MAVISCKKISFAYPKCEYNALTDVTFEVEQGEFCLVIGKSAAGKSTLLKLLKKEISPAGTFSGDIEINASVGFVSQNVDENIVCDKVRSELSFGLANMGMSGKDIELLVAETASYFNLNDKLDKDISSLSGGEKQMVNLAAVMIMRPDILVLDEPTSQLDPVSAGKFIAVIKQLHRDFSTTVIISEHSIDELFDYADSVAFMESSQLVIKSDSDHVLSFLKEHNDDMLNAVPLQLRIYDDARTIHECRKKLLEKNLTSPEIQDEKCDCALKVKRVFYAYQKGNDVLSNLSLKVYKNKINAIVGPNASGKSTLLKVISGVYKPYHGHIKKSGRVSMLCQNVYDLFTKERCSEEVQFGEITDYLGISDIKDKHPYDLSGGQAQRLAFAKVLSQNADIILLDEPTKGFDPEIKSKLALLLNDLCASGKTILLVSHDIEFVGEYAHYVSFLSGGEIITTLPRAKFFSSLNFYTTVVSKITKGIADNIVSLNDLIKSGGV